MNSFKATSAAKRERLTGRLAANSNKRHLKHSRQLSNSQFSKLQSQKSGWMVDAAKIRQSKKIHLI